MKSRSLVSLIATPLSVVLLAMAPAAQTSATWYVNGVTGNDSNACTAPADACKTIGHAISLASSGDSVMIAAGTYNENLYMGFSLSLIGSGASTTIIDGGRRNRVVTIPNNGSFRISHLTIRNGYTLCPPRLPCTYYGGGIYNAGHLTIDNSTVTANSTQCFVFGCGVWGGGIYNYRNLTITNSTLTGNSANGHGLSRGGGIYNAGRLTIDNSTISSNSANLGGGVYNYRGGLTIDNSTISGNSGGGIGACCLTTDASPTLQNSIVANSSLGGNCYGRVLTSHGYNLSSDETCNFNSAGDLNNIDPKLGPLQNNGGPTQTQALLPGSPAIDAGNPSGCTDGQGRLLTTDQRGKPRPDKEDTGGCDMGAYESQSD